LMLGGHLDHGIPGVGSVRWLDADRQHRQIASTPGDPFEIDAPRRTAMTSPFITSVDQWAGTTADSPARRRSSRASVAGVASSSKHQGSVAEASATKPGISTYAPR
jgi:hypothetical protein